MKKKIIIICGAVVLIAAIVVFANVLVTKLIPGWKYDEAIEAKKRADYEKAITLLTELRDYQDTQEQVAKAQIMLMRDASAGDLVTFGAYEQDKRETNGKEPIQQKNGYDMWIDISE